MIVNSGPSYYSAFCSDEDILLSSFVIVLLKQKSFNLVGTDFRKDKLGYFYV